MGKGLHHHQAPETSKSNHRVIPPLTWQNDRHQRYRRWPLFSCSWHAHCPLVILCFLEFQLKYFMIGSWLLFSSTSSCHPPPWSSRSDSDFSRGSVHMYMQWHVWECACSPRVSRSLWWGKATSVPLLVPFLGTHHVCKRNQFCESSWRYSSAFSENKPNYHRTIRKHLGLVKFLIYVLIPHTHSPPQIPKPSKTNKIVLKITRNSFVFYWPPPNLTSSQKETFLFTFAFLWNFLSYVLRLIWKIGFWIY